MSTANRVIKNTGFLYAKMGITMFISLYTTRLILNALGASDFGIFNIVGGAIAMLGFLNAAMAGATQRFISFSEGAGDKEKQKKIFNISFLLHFCIAILMGLALLIAGWFFFNGVLNIDPERIYAAKVVYGSLIISTIFTVMSVPYDAVLNAHENMLYYSIVGIVESVLKLGVAFVVVYMAGDKLVLYGILMAAVPLFILTIMRIYCHNHYIECKISPKRYFDKILMKEMTAFAGWNLLSSASTIITMQGVSIILNIFFGVIANAAHGVANQLSGQIMVFSNNMIKALNPSITKSQGADNEDVALKLSLTGNKLSFTLLAFFAIPFSVEMPTILSIWLKNPPEYTVVFCRLILIRLLLSQMYVTFGTAIGATGRIKNLTMLVSFVALLILPISALFYYYDAPIYFIYILLILLTILYMFIHAYFMVKYFKLPIEKFIYDIVFKGVLISIITSVVGLIPSCFLMPSVIRLVLVFAFSNLAFVSLIYFILLNSDERKLLKNIWTQLRKKF